MARDRHKEVNVAALMRSNRRKWAKTTIALLLGVLSMSILTFLFPRLSLTVVRFFWPTGIVWHGSETRPVVYLTFDDGPDQTNTPQVLSVLKARGVRATFFLVGERAAAHAALAKMICDEGHEIGNHGNTWGRTIGLSDADFEKDLIRAENTLAALPCYRKLFRPAAVMIRRSQVDVLSRHGYRCVLGSAYAFDPARPPVWFLTWATRQALRPGAIVVLHDGGPTSRQNTIDALPRIIDDAKRKGLSFEVLSALQ
jgi:peptidoglycan-N-acetylglucosamine deacetylase